ncbi:MAG: hypothetical protein H6969_02305 [Gammaproteobacteria bacterium]|nr:hypothetical protein [Gammaproteobacteria bacterium]MCP5459735.1 hypothetical protein [Gammaproteobacteria bacterium]
MTKVDPSERERNKRQTLMKRRWKARQDRAIAKIVGRIDATAIDAVEEIKAMTEAARKQY